MGRVLKSLLVAVWLVPTHSAAQTSSLPPTSSSDAFRATQRTYAPTYNRFPSLARQPIYGGYFLGGDSDASDPSPATSRYMAAGNEPTWSRSYEPGRLRLDVTPANARVYVDGSYIGTVDQVNSRSGGYTLPPGVHRVNVQARGYDGAGASVWVPPGQSVSYRDFLDPSAIRYMSYRAVSYRPVPYRFVPVSYFRESFDFVESPGGLYVIPGCYAGNSLPRPEKLLPGCKIENLRRVYRR